MYIMKVEMTAVNMVCYGCKKAAGRLPSSAKNFRHGGGVCDFASGRFFLWGQNVAREQRVNSSVSTKRTYHQNTDRPILTAVILTY